MNSSEYMRPKKHNNGFGIGFVLGFMLGAAVVFLFATKKGRKMMQVVMDEGMEKVSKLENAMGEYIDEDFEEMEVESAGFADQDNGVESAVKKAVRPVRRFFKKPHHKN